MTSKDQNWITEMQIDAEAELKGALYFIDRLKREITEKKQMLTNLRNAGDDKQIAQITAELDQLQDSLEWNEWEADELTAYLAQLDENNRNHEGTPD